MTTYKSNTLDLVLPILVFLLIGYANMSLDLLDGVSKLADVDDKMRFLQIRDLLKDGQWYDMQLPFIAMPEPYFSPWSRLVDLPYMALASLFSSVVSLERSLVLATWIVPPLLFVVFSWISINVATDLVGRQPNTAETVAMAVLLGAATFEFSPGRIDHHNFQLLACISLVKGTIDPHPVRAARWLGLSTVLSISVGLELVPLIFSAILIIGLFATMGDRSSVQKLQHSGVVIVAATPMAALLLLGPQNSLETHCDAFSLLWIAVLLGMAAGLICVPMAWRSLVSRSNGANPIFLRFLIAVAFASLIVGFLWTQFPSCHGGVYHMIDDVSRSFWLNNIVQEQSGAHYFSRRLFMIAGLPVVLAMVLCGLIVLHILQSPDKQFKPIIMLCCLLFIAICLTMVQGRFFRFLPALTLPLVPVAFELFQSEDFKKRLSVRHYKLGIAAIALATAALAGTCMWFAENANDKTPAADYMATHSCDDEDFSALAQIEPAIILAPFGITYQIVHADYGHRLLAVEFHRSSPGIRRMAQAFTSVDLAVRNQALKPVDYVVVCRQENAGDFDGAELYRRLVEGTPISGFVPIRSKAKSRLLIYKIDHEKLAI